MGMMMLPVPFDRIPLSLEEQYRKPRIGIPNTPERLNWCRAIAKQLTWTTREQTYVVYDDRFLGGSYLFLGGLRERPDAILGRMVSDPDRLKIIAANEQIAAVFRGHALDGLCVVEVRAARLEENIAA